VDGAIVTTELAGPRLQEGDYTQSRLPLAAERIGKWPISVHRDPRFIVSSAAVLDRYRRRIHEVPADHRDPDPDRFAVHGASFC